MLDLATRRLIAARGSLGYDYLVLCAGVTHACFGHDDWAPIAPGLKTPEDATELRRRILLAFESDEDEGSEHARRAVLFGIVGGGPTGVERAGAIKEIAGQTLPADYRHIDTRATRVIVFEVRVGQILSIGPRRRRPRRPGAAAGSARPRRWFQKKPWQDEIKRMLGSGLKYELDALANNDFRYLTKTYLPRKERDWLD